ncbi:MAG: efflux RND transporter periplasmic adaptor subunit [Balneolaceae bacterium]|nr:efflux RND transporter periplasmic adaptor subunit [Balneolaceae bacterium]MBO6649132.1 efflux RND transporter periplasmic adaptor subunit [Balneolaceae bacterium]
MAVLLACSSNENQNSGSRGNQNSVIPSVEAVQARYGSLPLVERFSGNVRSENQVPLYPQISAKVEQVFVENGQYVEKGQTLVQLDAEQYRQQLVQAEAGLNINKARLKQAEAGLAELKSRYNRSKQLADKELSSAAEIEQLEAELISAEANVELAEAQLAQSESLVEERREQLSRTTIKAPISGTIGQRNAQVGMQVSQNTQLFMIGDLTRLRVEIVLTESMLNKISIDQTARIMVEDYEGNDRIIEAKLSRISPFLNEVTRSTEAEIDVENKNGWLKPGMFVPVDILFGESEKATLIPVSAIYTDPTSGAQGVFIASSMGSEIQPVESSENDGNPDLLTEPTPVQFKQIDILAQGRMEVGVGGLESGQWVVTLGQDLLGEGREQARVRTVSWDKVIGLQLLQREDLLEDALQESTRPQASTL